MLGNKTYRTIKKKGSEKMTAFYIAYIKDSIDSYAMIFTHGNYSSPELIINERKFEKLYKEFKKQQKEWVKK